MIVPIEQTSFVGGELSPLVMARSDIAMWATGAARMLNFTPLSQGPARTRPGLRHVAFLPSAEARLGAFVFAASQRYVLCFYAGGFTAWTPDGTQCNVLGAPWTGDMLRRLSLVVSGDTIIVLHPEMQPRVLKRTAATTFTIALMTIETMPQQESADAWSDGLGWPTTGCFFQNRLVLAGSRTYPGGIWISTTNAYFKWDVGSAADDDAIVSGIEPTGTRVARILHAIASDRLLFLTDAGIWTARASADSPLTPKTFALAPVSSDGASFAQPVMFDNAVMWVDQTERVTRELLWSDEMNGYASSPTSLPAEHLIRRPHQIASYTGAFDRPEALALLANEDGTMAAFHSVRSEELAAWVPWETDGFVNSVAAVGEDVFASVTRTINGATTTRLERFDPGAEALDASATATLPAPGRTFSGFTHLAGARVACVSRGHYLGEAVVSIGLPGEPPAGTVTIPDGALDVDYIEVGLPFEQRLRPLPAALQMQTGSERASLKRLVRAVVQVDRAGFFRIAGHDVLLEFVGDDIATPAPTATGLFEFRMFGISREAQFDVVVAVPQRVTLLGLMREVSIRG